MGSDTFDVNQIDLTSVVFAGVGPVTYKNGANAGLVKAGYEDVNSDGVLDLVLQFKPDKSDLRDSFEFS